MTYGRLDYPAERLQPFGRDKIVMEANTDLERSMRLQACAKEPWTVHLIESLAKDEVLWDIGANVGSYTLLAAARGLSVVAFEPMAENFATLCRNLALNQLMDHAYPLQLALTFGHGMIWLHYSDMRSGAASHELTNSPKKVSLHKSLVPTLTADDAANLFGLPMPHAIKLDVDGGELGVLQGAEWVMSHAQLRAILCECQRNANGTRLAEWLGERGWRITEAYEPRGPIQYVLFGRAEVASVPAGDGQAEPVIEAPMLLLNRAERRRQQRQAAKAAVADE